MKSTFGMPLVAFCLSIAACTDVVDSSGATSGSDGFAYSLPKGQILLIASRTPVSLSDITAADAALAKAQAAVDADNKAVTAAAGDSTKLAAAQATLQTDTLTLKAAKSADDLANSNKNKWQEAATLTVLPIVPDPTARFTGRLHHNWTRDDTFKISLANGLLTSSSLTSTDQTPNLIVNLADTAISIATLAGLQPKPAPAQ
jgi:hypothetical protein